MGLGFRTIEQRITAGSQFTGVVPVGPPVRRDSLEAYAPGAVGGLIDPALEAPVFVRSVELRLGGQSAWTVHKRDLVGDELLIMCGTTEVNFITTECESFVLTARQALVIRTIGATAALICRVTLQSPV